MYPNANNNGWQQQQPNINGVPQGNSAFPNQHPQQFPQQGYMPQPGYNPNMHVPYMNPQQQYIPQPNMQGMNAYPQYQQPYQQVPTQFQPAQVNMGFPQHLLNMNFAGFNFGPRPKYNKDFVKQQAQLLFVQFTQQTGGQLYYPQLYQFLNTLSQRAGTTPVSQQQCDYLWWQHDTDRSGSLNFKETKKLVKNLAGLKSYSPGKLKKKFKFNI